MHFLCRRVPGFEESYVAQSGSETRCTGLPLRVLGCVDDIVVRRLDAHVVFLPMERDDVRHSPAALSRMADPSRGRILHGAYRPREVLAFMPHLDLAVGMRLHFLMFAAMSGVPFLPLPYAGKVFDFAQDMGALALRRVARAQTGLLLAEVDRLWDEHVA
ncbi:MAG: polysaccharide pyruvyl transferase family protein [Pseudonocardiaceae bacterium]